MSKLKSISRLGLPALSAGLIAVALGLVLGRAYPTQAALVDGGGGPQLVIGRDDDTMANAAIQAGAVANQSLERTDILVGGPGNDVIFGLNGDDVIDGGPGLDIILGGPDPGPPNSDIMFGGPASDVNLWAPGDGSEAFIGGQGLDAIVFGATDRDAVPDPETGVRLPTLLSGVPGFPQGIPTADVSGLPQHCTVETSPLPGYDSGAISRGGRQHHRHRAGERSRAGLLPQRGRRRNRVRGPDSSLAGFRRRVAARG